MIQTLLFATDIGLHTSYLLHHVNSLAVHYNARVVVVHAIEPPGHLGDAVVRAYLSIETQKEFENEGLSRIIDGVKGSIVDVLEREVFEGESGLFNISDVRVIAGKPTDVILDAARECAADMIILGSHGHDTDGPNLLGSVTSKILQISRIPVYMIPLVRNVHFNSQAK